MIVRHSSLGAEALRWLRDQEHFDVIVIDDQVADMAYDGLAQQIWDTVSNRPLRLIRLGTVGQGYHDPDQIFAATLTKPIKPSQVYEALIALFNRPSEDSPVSSSAEQSEPQAAEFPLRILLAEDNLVNQKVALRILQRLGYQADVAQNGVQVLEALHRQSYDLILMDVQMPVMDGLTATQRIRESKPDAIQPWIVAMTANALESDRQACLSAGMNDYLAKPIQLDHLIAVIRSCGRVSSGG
jgi:CheY-like chemotaxis protein